MDKHEFEKLEKVCAHHEEQIEKLYDLCSVEGPDFSVLSKELEKKWKKEIDHECDKLEKKLKKLKHDEKEHEKDHKGLYADKHVTKETFEMIYKKLRSLQEMIETKCTGGAASESESESEYETTCQPVTMQTMQ